MFYLLLCRILHIEPYHQSPVPVLLLFQYHSYQVSPVHHQGCWLPQVKCFALCKSWFNIYYFYFIYEFASCQTSFTRCSDFSSANDGYFTQFYSFLYRGRKVPIFLQPISKYVLMILLLVLYLLLVALCLPQLRVYKHHL